MHPEKDKQTPRSTLLFSKLLRGKEEAVREAEHEEGNWLD